MPDQMNIPGDAHYTVRVHDQGEIAVRGTAAFVAAHTPYLTGVAAQSLKQWHDQQVAAGRDPAEVQAEIQSALDRATEQLHRGERPVEIKSGASSH